MTGEHPLTYLDNAATSFPKPAAVAEAMSAHLSGLAVNPGRSGFDLSLAAAAAVQAVRTDLAAFFNLPGGDANRTVFTSNATGAINLALQGVLRTGDHVVATVLEHNSVLRPLHALAAAGRITFDLAPCDKRGFVDTQAVAALLRPATRLVVLNQASNVLGTLQPVAEIGRTCRERGILLLVDAAQSAGTLPVDMTAMNIDLLAVTGHKGLQGPTGTGSLLVAPGVDVATTTWGGTGVRSAQLAHPEAYPYRLEAGTLNTTGIAGLGAGLAWLKAQDPAALLAHERALTARFLDGLRNLPKVHVLGREPDAPLDLDRHLPVVSLVVEGQDPARTGLFLDADWNIAVRTGLHCAPLVHAAMGTGELGAVRFSFGPRNTPAQVDRALDALSALSA